MSDGTKKVFGLLGSLTSFRVSEKILKMVGVKMEQDVRSGDAPRK